jgi:hypothetical protein
MRKTLLLLLLFAAAVPLLAQDEVRCALADTPSDCFHRFVPKLVAVAQTAQTAEAKKEVTTANAGLTSLVSPNGSAVIDFLSRLTGSMQMSSLSANGQTLTFDWNPPLNATQPFKLQAVLNDPKVSTSVTTALASNAAAVTALNDEMTNTDDITVSGSYSMVNESYGRSIEPHRTLFQSLMTTVVSNTAAVDDAMFVALQNAGITMATFGTKFQNMSGDDAAKQRTLAAVEAASRGGKLTLDAASALTGAFAKLLNNQPQVYVSAMYHDRTPVAGPNEWIAKATYEYGFKNLNTFRKSYAAQCDPLLMTDDLKKQSCVDLLEKYAGDTKAPDAGSDPGRVAFSVEYRGADANNVKIPQYSLDLATKAGHSLVGSLTYGRVMMAREDRKSGRIDVAMSYEDISNAAAIPSIITPSADIKDRWVGSITYTQKMSDNMSFPISLVYANHSSYLPGVDRKLNAHFGLQYKMPAK